MGIAKHFIIILALVVFGSLASVPAARKIHQESPGASPKVTQAFQSEISNLGASGLRLKEAIEASLDGNHRHLAAVFERTKPKNPAEAFEFRIIETDGTVSKTIFRRLEFFFSFARQDLIRTNATDINGDGLKEVVVQSSSGGNCWSCNPAEVYRVRDHKCELIAAGPIQRITDLNGDGISELLVTDARWEVYEELSHAAAPSAVMIYAWREGQYVYASRDFPDYYRTELQRLKASITEAARDITIDEFSDEPYVGRSISLALTYAHIGELERGLKELEALMNSNARSAEQSKRRSIVLNDFRNGESAKKLRELKYGDPIPLG